jgi:hypothetical protein
MEKEIGPNRTEWKEKSGRTERNGKRNRAEQNGMEKEIGPNIQFNVLHDVSMFCYCFSAKSFDQDQEIYNFNQIYKEIRQKLTHMDFYKLSQEDFHVLEEKFTENNDLLMKKDSVSKI